MSIRIEKIKKIIPSRLDKKMGMGIIHSKNQVYVNKITPGSLAADYFQVKDRIVSINGVPVTGKKQCCQLILSASTESEFTVEIERRSTGIAEFQLPPMPDSEIDQIPDLHFIPSAEPYAPKAASPKKAPKKQPAAAPAVEPSYEGYMSDEEFAMGNPLEGLNFPAPIDVQDILKHRMEQILKDFMQTVSDKSKRSKRDSKSKAPSPSACTVEDSGDVQTMSIATDVPQMKQLMKPKK